MGKGEPGGINGRVGKVGRATRPRTRVKQAGYTSAVEEQITAFRSLGQGCILLAFATGELLKVDLNPLIAKGGVFTRLADDSYLSQAVLEDWGHCLEWPDGLDVGADTLYQYGKPASGNPQFIELDAAVAAK